ncbi:CopL family metal-binding regulatory protein [Tahibacter aquaticus]|uniref:CopL family metal-binding regulatory protein n=1 Tax=Tahibacter aquaticus TaxID=520092 RepID=UPI00105EAF57|nr:CopL family metal-binding regulatory protein [Tahibacter aquaticus]
MLRTATHFLLAIVLCLNGFLMPVAMAQHHVAAEKARAAVADAPCHGDAAARDGARDGASGHTQHGEKAPASKHSTPSCCTHGQCACGCLMSAGAAPLAGVTVPPHRDVKGRDFSCAHLTAARYTVPLRPPIA